MAESSNSVNSLSDGNVSQATYSIPVLTQSHPIGIKLTESNYLVWKQQIMSTIRGFELQSYLSGDDNPPRLVAVPGSALMRPNPDYLAWNRQDQLLASWIQSSLTERIMVLVVGLMRSKEIWKALETNFAGQSKAKVMQYKLQLQSAKKNSLPMRDYLSKIKRYCDMLGAAGCRISEDDHILYVLGG